LAGVGVHFGVQNSGSTSDCATRGRFRVVDVERGGGRVLVAGDVTDCGEVASDRGHVREGRVPKVVGAEVLGFVLGGEHLARCLNQDSSVLEAREDEAFVRADLIERAARAGRQRDGAGVARLVDAFGDLKG
jgi:hypothetical protein